MARADARVLLAAAHLEAGAGGIAAVARLTARVLIDEGCAVTALSLLDRAPVTLAGARRVIACANRPTFLARHCAETLANAHVVYDSAGIARAHKLGLPRPFATWMHGVDVWRHLSPPRLAALRAARLPLVNSHFTLRRFEEMHGEPLAAQMCWLATASDAPGPPRAHDHDPVVMTLGRIDARQGYKGHAELIAAWPTILAAVPRARLVIAGGGASLEQMRALAASSPAAAAIDLPGFVPEAELDALWARTSVFAMPSRGEGFGIVYAEAMRHGRPVLASVHDAGAEVNVDGETGFNVDLDRNGDLAEKLIALLRDPDLAARLGSSGQARWREHFSYSAFRRRLAPLLQRFLAAP
jgi:phosphatidyl-myo-inositol dimannoside synthase